MDEKTILRRRWLLRWDWRLKGRTASQWLCFLMWSTLSTILSYLFILHYSCHYRDKNRPFKNGFVSVAPEGFKWNVSCTPSGKMTSCKFCPGKFYIWIDECLAWMIIFDDSVHMPICCYWQKWKFWLDIFPRDSVRTWPHKLKLYLPFLWQYSNTGSRWETKLPWKMSGIVYFIPEIPSSTAVWK